MVRNKELATAANITPFTVSRLISEWQRTGMLAKSRERFCCPHPNACCCRMSETSVTFLARAQSCVCSRATTAKLGRAMIFNGWATDPSSR